MRGGRTIRDEARGLLQDVSNIIIELFFLFSMRFFKAERKRNYASVESTPASDLASIEPAPASD